MSKPARTSRKERAISRPGPYFPPNRTESQVGLSKPSTTAFSKVSRAHLPSLPPSLASTLFVPISPTLSPSVNQRSLANSSVTHNTFIPVYIHTAKCDICNKRNARVLQRCNTCNFQICITCFDAGLSDGFHNPDGPEVDWTVLGAQGGSKPRRHLRKSLLVSTATEATMAKTRGSVVDPINGSSMHRQRFPRKRVNQDTLANQAESDMLKMQHTFYLEKSNIRKKDDQKQSHVIDSVDSSNTTVNTPESAPIDWERHENTNLKYRIAKWREEVNDIAENDFSRGDKRPILNPTKSNQVTDKNKRTLLPSVEHEKSSVLDRGHIGNPANTLSSSFDYVKFLDSLPFHKSAALDSNPHLLKLREQGRQDEAMEMLEGAFGLVMLKHRPRQC